MATLTLTKVFVNLLQTGQSVSYQSSPGRIQQYAVEGNVRTYGGGRQRSVATTGETGNYQFVLRSVTATDVATLRSWEGLPILVRNHKGERYFGTLFALKVTEQFADPVYDVDITVLFLTATDAV